MQPSRLEKVKRLYLGATTPGERAAASAAISRLLRDVLEQDRRVRRTTRTYSYRPQMTRVSRFDSLDIAIRCFNARHQGCQIPTDAVTAQAVRSVYFEAG